MQIPVIVDLPVGANLQDHYLIGADFVSTENISPVNNVIEGFWSKMQYGLFGKGKTPRSIIIPMHKTNNYSCFNTVKRLLFVAVMCQSLLTPTGI